MVSGRPQIYMPPVGKDVIEVLTNEETRRLYVTYHGKAALDELIAGNKASVSDEEIADIVMPRLVGEYKAMLKKIAEGYHAKYSGAVKKAKLDHYEELSRQKVVALESHMMLEEEGAPVEHNNNLQAPAFNTKKIDGLKTKQAIIDIIDKLLNDSKLKQHRYYWLFFHSKPPSIIQDLSKLKNIITKPKIRFNLSNDVELDIPRSRFRMDRVVSG